MLNLMNNSNRVGNILGDGSSSNEPIPEKSAQEMATEAAANRCYDCLKSDDKEGFSQALTSLVRMITGNPGGEGQD